MMLPSKNLSPIRVVVVDDSPTVRELLVGLLQEAGDIIVVGTGEDGEDAVRLTKRLHPDLVTMDIRMPVMDGFEATRRIMRECPIPIVVITASMKIPDMDLTFRALQAGALTVIHKPGLDDPQTGEKVVQTVRVMAGVPVVHHWSTADDTNHVKTGATINNAEAAGSKAIKQPILRLGEVDIIGVASSTGGPAALATIFRKLPKDYPLPILVVQHVSPGFTPGLAEWLSTQTQMSVDIASHGVSLRPGVAMLAPDDYHMQINERGVVELSKAAAYKGLRPSANFLFGSLARVFGPRAVGIMLTGMGDDGANGIEALHQAGGLVIAQDQESCVVYGMPHEVVARKAVDHVMSLEQIATTLEAVHSSKEGLGEQGGKR